MKRALIILSVLLVVVVTPFVPQFLDYVSASIRKTGVVIDDETGQPMPNVIVIAAASRTATVFMNGSRPSKQLYRVLVQTDENGRFEIPGQWTGFHASLPLADPQYQWVITVFQTGYAVVGDRPDREVFVFGNPTYENPSVIVAPEYSFRGTHYEVDPIRMYKPTLGLKEAAVYYSGIMNTGGRNPFAKKTPIEDAMRQQGYDLFAPWVCGLNPSMGIKSAPRNSVLGFANDEIKAYEKIAKQSVHEGFLPGEFAPSTKAGLICAILTDGRGAP